MTSKSKRYYDANPEAYAKKLKYDTKYHSTDERIQYRSELNQYNRDKGTYGNGDGKDASHEGGKIKGMENQSTNRARKTKKMNKKKKKLTLISKEKRYKLKKAIKEKFGKKMYKMGSFGKGETGEGTEFTVSKKRIKKKGPKGTIIHKKGSQEYQEIKTALGVSSKNDKLTNK